MSGISNWVNPYSGLNFFEVIQLFLIRLVQGILEPDIHLASDEIQLLVLSAVAFSAGIIGGFLVLRKMAMLANAISHTVLLGIALAYFVYSDPILDRALPMPAILSASVLVAMLTTFLTQKIHLGFKLQEDASIGLVFSALFALGVIAISSLGRNTHIGIEVIMGNADSLVFSDLFPALAIAGLNLVIVSLFYKQLSITTFDRQLSQSMGINPRVYDYLLMFQVSLTIIVGFRAVGSFLVLAYLVGLPLTARLMTDRLKQFTILSGILGLLLALISVALSRHLLTLHGLALSTGGLSVTLLLLLFIAALIGNQARLWYNRRNIRRIDGFSE